MKNGHKNQNRKNHPQKGNAHLNEIVKRLKTYARQCRRKVI